MNSITKVRPITAYIRQNYWPLKEGFYRVGSESIIQVQNGFYKKVPQWLYRAIVDEEAITYMYGPYVFFNGFEKTTEGKYVLAMAKHEVLTPKAKMKFDAILQNYGFWIRVDQEYMEDHYGKKS